MRKNIFSWMAIAICAAAATGCGSSGSDATSYVVPSIPGVSASEKLVTFSVKDYEKTDNCRLVISTVGKSEDDTAAKRVYVSSDTSYAEPDAAVASAKIAQERTKKIDSKPSACGFSAVLHKVAPAQLVTSYKDDNPGVDDSKVRFLEPQDNAEPSVDFIWATFNGENKQVPVCKVLKDSETVHCNIISYAVTDSRGIYQPVVSVEDAKMIAELFDSYNPNDPTGKNRGIYEQITTEIGHEWIKNGGRDGDPKVNIILLPNDLMVVSSGGGSDESTESDSSGDSTSTDAKIRVLAANDEGSEEEIIYGAVNPLDEFVPVEGNNPNYSNGGEFIYINYEALLADNSNGMTKVDLATTLAHQFTHLVQLNASVCHDGRFGTVANDGGGIYSLADAIGPSVTTEGMAELGATLCGLGVYYAKNGEVIETDSQVYQRGSHLSLNRIANYMDSEELPDYKSYFPVSLFSEELSTDAKNGAGHLLGLYLLNRYGKDKVKAFITGQGEGIESMEAAFGDDIGDILHGFNIAVALGGGSNIPKDYQIPYVSLDGINYYYNDSSYASESAGSAFSSLYIYGAQSIYSVYPKVEASELRLLPWINGLISLPSTTSNPLTVQVVVPKSASVTLLHQDSVGAVKKIY